MTGIEPYLQFGTVGLLVFGIIKLTPALWAIHGAFVRLEEMIRNHAEQNARDHDAMFRKWNGHGPATEEATPPTPAPRGGGSGLSAPAWLAPDIERSAPDAPHQ